MVFDLGSLTAWIIGFLVLGTIGPVLAVTAMVRLHRTSGPRPSLGSVRPQPAHVDAGAVAVAEQAA